MPRNKAPRQNEDVGEFVCVKWCDDNKYSTLSISKLMEFVSGMKGADFIGKVCQIKWSDGRIYSAEVVKSGTKASMLQEEEKLEKQAADLSMEVHGDDDGQTQTRFFALVNWREDGKLSVLSSAKLKIAGHWKPDDDLCGRNAEGNWKGSWLPVTVVANGSKTDMKRELKCRVSEGSSKKHVDDNAPVEDNDDTESQSQLEERVEEIVTEDKDAIIAKLTEEVADWKRKHAAEEARSKKFRRMLNKIQQPSSSDDAGDQVDIGGGLLVSKTVDDYVKFSYPNNPMKFLKNLLIKGGIFSLEELATHSLKGGKSPKVPSEAREMLDPAKLKAAFDYTVACLRLKEDPVKLMKFETNLKDLCTNARKELKNSTK